MKIQLIEGEFKPNDALDLITQMIQIKIKFHENKIEKNQTEEDIKGREEKIKRLQKNIFELRKSINSESDGIKISAFINIE